MPAPLKKKPNLLIGITGVYVDGSTWGLVMSATLAKRSNSVEACGLPSSPVADQRMLR